MICRSKRGQAERRELRFGNPVMEQDTRDVSLDGSVVLFTPKEFDVLVFLALSPRRVYSKAQLLREVCGSSPQCQEHTTVGEHCIVFDANSTRTAGSVGSRRFVVWGIGSYRPLSAGGRWSQRRLRCDALSTVRSVWALGSAMMRADGAISRLLTTSVAATRPSCSRTIASARPAFE